MRKIQNMNNKGKANMLLAVGAIALVLILGFIVYNQYMPTSQSVVGVPTQAGIISSGCNINPSLVMAVTDKLNSGTSVTTANNNFRINGVYAGTTSPTTPGTMDTILNSAGYISELVSGAKLICGSQLFTANMYALTNATLTYYSDNGLNALTMSTVNESVKAAGGSYNWKLHMQGVDKKSTGQMLLVVEASIPANITSLTLNGGTEVAVPNGYTRQLTNGYAKAFLLPALTGNAAVDYNLAAVAASGKIVQGTVYSTIFNVQPFVETDGTFSNSGQAFDSLNAAKYATSQTKNFIIA